MKSSNLWLLASVAVLPWAGCGLSSGMALAVRAAMLAPHLKIVEAGQAFASSLDAALAGDATKQAELAAAHRAVLAAYDAALAEMNPQGRSSFHAPTEAKKVAQGPELCQAFRQFLEAQRALVQTEYGDIVKSLGEGLADPERLSTAKSKLSAAKARSAENLAKLHQADQAFCKQNGIQPPKAFEGW